MKIAFSILLLTLMCVPGLAQWQSDSKKASDTSDRKSVNGFGVHLVAIKDPRGFVQEWQKPETPKIKSAKKVKPGEPLGIIVIFAGCKEVARTCNSEVDYTIYKPDGSVFVERLAQPLWKEQAPPKPNIQLGRAILSFQFKKDQPSGQYKIKAKVKDINADTTVEVETQVELNN